MRRGQRGEERGGNRVARAARLVLLHTLIIGLKNVNVNVAWKVFGALFDSSR